MIKGQSSIPFATLISGHDTFLSYCDFRITYIVYLSYEFVVSNEENYTFIFQLFLGEILEHLKSLLWYSGQKLNKQILGGKIDI